MTLKDDVVRVAKRMAGPEPADDEAIDAELLEAGRTGLESQLLVMFVPHGFGRAVLAGKYGKPRMPKSLPDTVQLWGRAKDRRFEVRLIDVPQYRAAYDVAAEALRDGTLDRKIVSAVANRGCEMRAIHDGLAGGHDLSVSTFSTPIFPGLADRAGFDGWLASLSKHTAAADAWLASLPPPAAESDSWFARLQAWWPWASRG